MGGCSTYQIRKISPIFTAFCEVVQDVCDIIQRLWTEVIDPILASLVTSLTELWNTHLSPLFSDLIAVGGDAINAIATVIKALWDNVIDPLANWLLSTFGPVFTQVFNSAAGIVTNAIGIVADVLDIGLICLQAVIDFIKRIYLVTATTAALAFTMAMPAFAANDPLTTINNLSDFVFSAIKAIGAILLGFGIVQIGLALKGHDASQRAQGFMTFFGGVVIYFAKDILDMIL